jgi:TrmH family RNA methyltransferase
MKNNRSISNKTLKWIKKLFADAKYRHENNLAVAEGKKVFSTIINYINRKQIKSIIVTNDFFLANKKLLANYTNLLYFCPSKLFKTISHLKTPEGIICIIQPNKDKIVYSNSANYLAVYNLQNPNNLGSLIRSCLAFNIENLFLIGNCCDIYHPDTIRSSMGYVFGINVQKFNNLDYFFSLVKINCLQLIALANTTNATKIYEYKNKINNCFLIGNEANGLPNNILKKCQTIIKIPLNKNVDSLNASVAASIVAFYLNYANN